MTKSESSQKEHPIWKVLTFVIGLMGIGCSLFCHFDAKRSTEYQIVKALAERYETVDEEMSYEQALEAVDRDIKLLKADNTTLKTENTALQDEIKSLKDEIDYSEKIALAESYATSDDYSVAIPILNSIPEKGEDTLALLKEYTSNYEIEISQEAEIMANSGDFNGAMSLIDEALKVIPNSSILLEKKDVITPHYLVDVVECHKAENLWLLDKRESIKMSGKSYQHAIYSESSEITVNMLNGNYSAFAFYNLDGKYTQLSGITGHIDFSGSGSITEHDAGQVYDAEVSIWGDDKELTTISLLSTDSIKNFNLPIKGVKILEFRIECSGNSKVGIADIQIR